MPSRVKANRLPVRNPVWISSQIKRMPWASQRSRIARRYPSRGTRTPPSPRIRLDDDGSRRAVHGLRHCFQVVEWNMADSLEHGREWIAILRIRGRGQRAVGSTVIGTVRGDDTGAAGGHARVLERGLDGLGTGVAEGDPGQAGR